MLQKKKQTRSFFTIVRPGFTLAEMILVIALTLFLMTVTAQGFANSASQFSFVNVDQRVQDMILSARSLAISGKAQIDYTDFDKDGCKDAVTTPSLPCLGDDYVTPANYGVDFRDTADVSGNHTYTVTEFADNHVPNPCAAPPCGLEGQFDYKPTPTLADYQHGYDIQLDQYVLTPGTKLIIPGGPAAASTTVESTILFSPIFADASFNPPLSPADDPFFKFGVSQSSGTTMIRKRCYQIHKLAGISDPVTTSTNPTCP